MRRRLFPKLPVWLSALALALSLSAGCVYQNSMKRGDAAMAAGQFETAIEEYQRALSKKPDSQEAKDKLTQAQDKAVEVKAEEARRALASGDFMGAVRITAEAAGILPNSAVVGALVEEIVPAAIGEGERLTGEARYADAMALYDALQQGLPQTRARVQTAADATRDAWVAALDAGAKAAETAGRKGDALLQRAQIVALTGDGGAKADCDRLRQELRATHGLIIAQKGRDAGFKALSPRLVGSDSVRWLQVLAPGTKEPPARATLEFGLGRAKFKTDKARRSESAQYQSGTKQVPNPFYEQRQRGVTEQEARVVQAEQDVMKQQQKVEQYRADVAREGDTPGTTTGAEQNLYNAENRLESERRSLESEQNQLMQKQRELANTSQYTEEPVYETVNYTVTTHTLRATAQLSGSLTLGDAPPIQLAQSLSEEARDDEHSGQSQAGVAPDPLDLPSQDSLAQKLQGQALSVLESAINSGFNTYRAGYMEQAQGAANDDARVESLVLFTLLDPTQSDAQVDATLWQLRGIPSASALLRGEGRAPQ